MHLFAELLRELKDPVTILALVPVAHRKRDERE